MSLYCLRVANVQSKLRPFFLLDPAIDFSCPDLPFGSELVDSTPYARPPKEIPAKFYEQFTLNDRIPVKHRYIDGTTGGHSPKTYTKEDVESFFPLIRARKSIAYESDPELFKAMEEHRASFEGKHVLVVGSVDPHYEAMALYYGAKNVTTVEWNKLDYRHPQLNTLLPHECVLPDCVFDAAFVISSYEHDGLGRYGDPIRPYGDLQSMARLKCVVRQGGTVVLAVPVGPDTLVWNAHRVYGHIRFPLLTRKYTVLGSYPPNYYEEAVRTGDLQAIFVLRND